MKRHNEDNAPGNDGHKESAKDGNSSAMRNIHLSLKKAWEFIWKSDSVWSWLINIVLAFLFIKFIFYPLVGIMLTEPSMIGKGELNNYPLVAVVSGSMEHMMISHDEGKGPYLCGRSFDKTSLFVDFDEYWATCGSWYDERNISKEAFSGFLFKNGFNTGDIIFVYRKEPKSLKIGDVIVFTSNIPAYRDPIIHRIVSVNLVNGKYVFDTKGDHNEAITVLDSQISEDRVLGTGVFRIPFLGWIKIWFVKTYDFALPYIANIINAIR